MGDWAAMKTAMRAEAVVDLAALRGNVAALRARAGRAAVMTVVKADAYGHGLLPCAREALAAGVRWLGTATPEEALALRAAGIGAADARVLCWLWTPGGPWAEAVEAEVDVSVSARWALDELLAAVRATGRPARVHLKADTGLGRNGCQPHDWPALVAAARAAEAEGLLTVSGIWSHFAAADEPGHPSVPAQLAASAPRWRSPSGPACGPRCGTSPTPRPLCCCPSRTSTWSAPGSRATGSRRCRSWARRRSSVCAR